MTLYDLFDAINHIDEELLIRSELWSVHDEWNCKMISSANNMHTCD